MNEATLQDGIREHLAKVQGLRSYAFAASGTHGPLHGVIPTGWPDLLVLAPIWLYSKHGMAVSITKHVYFEVKAMRGKVTREQERMHEELRELGCRIGIIRADSVADGVRQVEAILMEEGVVLRSWE